MEYSTHIIAKCKSKRKSDSVPVKLPGHGASLRLYPAIPDPLSSYKTSLGTQQPLISLLNQLTVRKFNELDIFFRLTRNVSTNKISIGFMDGF